MFGRFSSVFVALAVSFVTVLFCERVIAAANEDGSKQDGKVDWRNERLLPEDVVERAKSDPLLSEYVAKRSATQETIADQMKLATWCRQKGLPEQQRVHLTKVLELAPDHAEARSSLGFRKVDGQWLDREEMVRSNERAKSAARTLNQYLKPLKAIVAGLKSNEPKMRASAKSRLMAITDPAAIPAMEAALGQAGDVAELALIEALSVMSSPEASVSLARVAIDTRSSDVRDVAVKELKAKNWDDFVPPLMSSLITPIVSRVDLYQSPDGRLTYRHRFYCEGEEARRMAVLDQTFRNRLGGPIVDAAAVAQRQTAIATTTALASITIEDNNEGICKLLNRVTDLNLPAKPEVWWSWWNDVTETALAEEKPLYQNYVSQEQVLNDAPTYFAGLSDGYRPRRCECLVAGTQVWTQTGPQPIESIQAGDLVLSKDTESGELAYKPVLRPTVRAPVPLIAIRLSNETIVASGGHLFWTANSSWQRARQLQAGTVLQLLDGTVEVQATEEVKPETTYNLIVADFHTYFVGPNMLLSHDNTSRKSAARLARVQTVDNQTRN